tara:strand:+ start:3303 stop:3608 length:306 start_codon:yes stop_codon:yes gene_type:complete
MYNYRATVVKVVDGDTVDLLIDLGFNISIKVRGRLANVDTPERGHSDWRFATETCTALLKEHADEDGYVYVRTTKTGKYGRWIVDILGVNKTLAERWPYES